MEADDLTVRVHDAGDAENQDTQEHDRDQDKELFFDLLAEMRFS